MWVSGIDFTAGGLKGAGGAERRASPGLWDKITVFGVAGPLRARPGREERRGALIGAGVE